MEDLTTLEKTILDFIDLFISEKHYSPSIRDISKGCYISSTCAHKYVKRLFNKGYINLIENQCRTIYIKKEHM